MQKVPDILIIEFSLHLRSAFAPNDRSGVYGTTRSMHPRALRTSAKAGIDCSQRWDDRAFIKHRHSHYLMIDCHRRGVRNNDASSCMLPR
jgi:hypothetical protein